jgi:hypothetical protein
MQNPERAIAYLVGEVHALFMFSQALAQVHPHPEQLLATLEIAEQLGLAHLEPHPVQDAVIDGYQHVISGLRKALGATQPQS